MNSINSSQSGKIQPSDLVVLVDGKLAELMGGQNTVYKFDILGNKAKEASGLFGQANEALYRQNLGWEKTYEEAAAKFERITGFRPEAVYEAEDKLREGIGLKPLFDRQRRPISEGLNKIRQRIEG